MMHLRLSKPETRHSDNLLALLQMRHYV